MTEKPPTRKRRWLYQGATSSPNLFTFTMERRVWPRSTKRGRPRLGIEDHRKMACHVDLDGRRHSAAKNNTDMMDSEGFQIVGL